MDTRCVFYVVGIEFTADILFRRVLVSNDFAYDACNSYYVNIVETHQKATSWLARLLACLLVTFRRAGLWMYISCRITGFEARDGSVCEGKLSRSDLGSKAWRSVVVKALRY